MSKTVVSLSFDDGREDTARVAYPIMKKYGLTATVHITTGFIDETWKDHNWKSCSTPMSIDDIVNMYNDGFEISLHGDKHVTDKEDFMIAKEKLASWGINIKNLGFSVPNSKITETEKEDFSAFLKKYNIKYMRCGRSSKCYTLFSKICYVLYRTMHIQACYNMFNRHNLNNPKNNYDLKTVVVKSTDKASLIKKFIEKNKSDSHVILMLHSILYKSDKGYGADSWYWDAVQFEELCKYLKEAYSNGDIVVSTICEERPL